MNKRLAWYYDLSAALEAARQERRFVLADFSKEH
jgi:hypothetical protein